MVQIKWVFYTKWITA